MKVLQCIDGLHPGGKERRLVELLKSLASGTTIEAELLVMSEENRYPEVLGLGIPIWRLLRRTPHDVGIFARLFRLCRQRRPDVIHTWDPMTALYAAPAAALLGIPLVNGMITKAPARLSWHSAERLLGALTFPFSAYVVGNSEAGLRSYRAPRGKSRCIHNGFNFDRLRGLDDPGETRRRFGVATPLLVAMAGEFTPKKDYPVFIAAAQMVLDRRDDVTFLAAGDGPTLASVQLLVEQRHRARILFPGWVEKVESMMLAADVGVLATDAGVHGEGIPNAVLEFMALGRPVVATHAGGTAELVVEGETGFLVDSGDVPSMAGRLMQLLDDGALRRRLGECGRQRIRTHFSMASMTASFRDLYDEAVSRSVGFRNRGEPA